MPKAQALFPLVAIAIMSAMGTTGCDGQHDALKSDPPGGAGGMAGAGGEPSMGGGGAVNGGMGGTGGVIKEPTGETKLTIVGGIADYPDSKMCFVSSRRASAAPWPVQGVLGFAQTRVIDPIEEVLDPEADVTPWAIVGDFTSLGAATCDTITADPSAFPEVIVAPLPTLPASVFQSGKSVLLVPMGCMGGVTHESAQQALACGEFYSPDTPSPSLVAVSMSRITSPGKVGLQGAHASVALSTVDLYVTPGFSAASRLLMAPLLSLGAAGPFPPFSALSLSDLGVVENAQISTYFENNGNPADERTLSTVLGVSTLGPDDIAPSANFMVVVLGAAPGAPSGQWWNPYTLTLVRTDPL